MKTREQAVAEKGAWGNPDTMSANPNDELQGELKERDRKSTRLNSSH